MRHLTLLLFLVLSSVVSAGQFRHSLKGDRHPWTNEPTVLGNSYKFIIVADRTGGEQGGVFDKAIPVINSLKPDFILSVGDLIDGYSTNVGYLNRQWDDFNRSVDKFNAPFFYVPGNHDICNPESQNLWIQRYGADYYSFNVGTSLFIVLNTDQNGRAGLGEDQVRFAVGKISAHPSEQPVFVFMHRPLWNEPGSKGLEQIESALRGFGQVLFFAGHEHRYLSLSENNTRRYMLATLGGGSNLRDLTMGEFHHFMEVTVAANRVDVRNYLANGKEIAADIVDAQKNPVVRELNRGEWFTVKPTVVAQQQQTQLMANLLLRNRTGHPMVVSGAAPAISGGKFKPAAVYEQLAPHSEREVGLLLGAAAGSPLDIDKLQNVAFSLQAEFDVQGAPIKSSSRQKWHVDYLRKCSNRAIEVKEPGYVHEDWDWKGPTDGYFTFRFMSRGDSLVLEVETFDDMVISDTDNPKLPQDRITIVLDDLAAHKRFEHIFNSDGAARNAAFGLDSTFAGCASAVLSKKGMLLKVALPKHIFKQKELRLNIGFTDHDNPLNTKPSTLWWKPKAELGGQPKNESLGIFTF